MSRDMLMAVIAVAAVALLSLLLRRAAGGSATRGPSMPPPPEPDPDEEVLDDDAAEAGALTSDGWSFMPLADRDRVRLIPPLTPAPGIDPTLPRAAPEQLARGDLLAARVKRGAPDHDPWRLEALGRDGEYRAWRFETEEAARAALAMVSRSIVAPPRDEDGAEIAFGDADFVEARRREEEIEAQLATLSDGEEPDTPLRQSHE
jgi:hypothetical protein